MQKEGKSRDHLDLGPCFLAMFWAFLFVFRNPYAVYKRVFIACNAQKNSVCGILGLFSCLGDYFHFYNHPPPHPSIFIPLIDLTLEFCIYEIWKKSNSSLSLLDIRSKFERGKKKKSVKLLAEALS